MSYTPLDVTKPDGATQNGTQVLQSIRDNEHALRDALLCGAMPGMDMKVVAGTGTIDAPQYIYFYTTGGGSSSGEAIRATITWGTTGGSAGNPTVIVFAYAPSGGYTGGTYSTIKTLTMTYDASGNVTDANWS